MSISGDRPPPPANSATRIPAAQYVRMSTEHQQYSTENQADVILEYAMRRGFELVRTYTDAGKSGLRIDGRDGLKQLLMDVQSDNAPFKAILVYDVSRWGRFQDADESAYYEYLCRRAGIAVHYCSEQFENDGAPVSTIIKSVKRAMAGEYSRELSSKVFKGQCKLIELGYRQGGMAGYGLRRMLLDVSGTTKGILLRGQQKSLQTDRVVLVPGPDNEVRTVLWMYQQFTSGKAESEIAATLNSQGLVTDLGRPWTRGTVREVLTNEKYIGNNVYNRTSFKLKKKHVANPPEMWVRSDGAFEGIVSADLFYMARGIIVERNRRLSDEEMLDKLRALIGKHDSISSHLIDATEDMPASASYRTRFGGLLQAYRLAGYSPGRDYGYLEINRALRALYPDVVQDVLTRLTAVGATVDHDDSTGLLVINREYSASLVLSRYRETGAGAPRWLIRFDGEIVPDITVLVRMDADNKAPTDFYLLPIMDIRQPKLLLCESNGAQLDTYQCDSLDAFTELAAREKIEVAA